MCELFALCQLTYCTCLGSVACSICPCVLCGELAVRLSTLSTYCLILTCSCTTYVLTCGLVVLTCSKVGVCGLAGCLTCGNVSKATPLAVSRCSQQVTTIEYEVITGVAMVYNELCNSFVILLKVGNEEFDVKIIGEYEGVDSISHLMVSSGT